MPPLSAMDSPPGRRATHLVADFIELMCTATADGEWGVPDLNALRKAKDSDHATVEDPSTRDMILDEDDQAEIEVDVAVAAALDLPLPEDEQRPPTDADEDVANSSAGPAASDDKRSTEASDIAAILAYRKARFGDMWPFELIDGHRLKLRATLESTHRSYLLLLVASCLARLSSQDENVVTTAFERMAADVLSGHLGPRVEAHLFGTSTTGTDHYSGTLWEKLAKLGADLRFDIVADQAEVESATGDNGLDAVAWVPTGDDATTVVAVFAQCACGKEWRKKQDEPSEQNWTAFLTFRSPVINMTIIPYSFRRSDGTWFNPLHIRQGVLLDRERIMEALVAGEANHDTLVPGLIDEIVSAGA